MSDWDLLAGGVPGSEGITRYVDTTPFTTSGTRYYRVMLQ